MGAAHQFVARPHLGNGGMAAQGSCHLFGVASGLKARLEVDLVVSDVANGPIGTQGRLQFGCKVPVAEYVGVVSPVVQKARIVRGSVVRRKGNQIALASKNTVQLVQKSPQFAVQPQIHIFDFNRTGAQFVSHVVGGRETERQHVRRCSPAQLLLFQDAAPHLQQ